MKHIVISILCLAALSCSREQTTGAVKLKGKVSLAGKPYAGATIHVALPPTANDEGAIVEATSGEDGSYTVSMPDKSAGQDWIVAVSVPGATAVQTAVLDSGSNMRVQDFDMPEIQLTGTVKAYSGPGIAKARVLVSSEGVVIASVATDERGWFKLPVIAEKGSTLTLRVRHPDYKFDGYARVKVETNEPQTHVVLAKEFKFHGLVMNADKKPIKGAVIRHSACVVFSDGGKGRASRSPNGEIMTITDARGQFELGLPVDGEAAEIEVTANGYCEAMIDIDLSQKAAHDIILKKGYLIKGHVEGSAGASVHLYFTEVGKKGGHGILVMNGEFEWWAPEDTEYILSVDDSKGLEGPAMKVKPGQDVVVKVQKSTK